MKILFYCALDYLKDVFIPPVSLPRLKIPCLMIVDVLDKQVSKPRKVSYQPPQRVRKDAYLKGHRQR